MKRKVIALFLFFASVFSFSCTKDSSLQIKREVTVVASRLNSNVENIRVLLEDISHGKRVTSIITSREEFGGVLYEFCLEDNSILKLYSKISNSIDYPSLSVARDGSDFFWLVDNDWLTDGSGKRVSINSNDVQPHFYHEEGWKCSFGSFSSLLPSNNGIKPNQRDINIDYNESDSLFSFIFSTGIDLNLNTHEDFSIARYDVLNDAYYNDIFLDAGLGLTSRTSLYAAKTLQLSLETICLPRSLSEASDEEFALQNAVLGGNDIDINGRLLYPDGQPRYRLLFVNGGSSTSHGSSLNRNSLDNIRKFVFNGGSYVGTCAGAFFASNGFDKKENYSNYLSIWPAVMNHTGISNLYIEMNLEKDSPLKQYYNFGSDNRIDKIRHNLGGYPASLPDGTIVLARYYLPDNKIIHNKPSVWSYKEGDNAGRVVLSGSHPEEESSGEPLGLTGSMIKYALDGRGLVYPKHVLHNKERYVVNKQTNDNDVDHIMIGDRQCHHFPVFIPANARNIVVSLSSNVDCELALMMNYGSYSFHEDYCDYCSNEGGQNQEIALPSIDDGVWFVTVKCCTTVSPLSTERGQVYQGRTDVLNGVPYIIGITWENVND